MKSGPAPTASPRTTFITGNGAMTAVNQETPTTSKLDSARFASSLTADGSAACATIIILLVDPSAKDVERKRLSTIQLANLST